MEKNEIWGQKEHSGDSVVGPGLRAGPGSTTATHPAWGLGFQPSGTSLPRVAVKPRGDQARAGGSVGQVASSQPRRLCP